MPLDEKCKPFNEQLMSGVTSPQIAREASMRYSSIDCMSPQTHKCKMHESYDANREIVWEYA